MLSLPENLGFRFLSYVWVLSAVGGRKIRSLESLHFRVLVNKRKSFLGISSRKRVTKWYVFISYAYPYATKMDAVDTRMLTLCVSVCYKKMDAVVTRKLTFCVSVCYKNGGQWLHGS